MLNEELKNKVMTEEELDIVAGGVKYREWGDGPRLEHFKNNMKKIWKWITEDLLPKPVRKEQRIIAR